MVREDKEEFMKIMKSSTREDMLRSTSNFLNVELKFKAFINDFDEFISLLEPKREFPMLETSISPSIPIFIDDDKELETISIIALSNLKRPTLIIHQIEYSDFYRQDNGFFDKLFIKICESKKLKIKKLYEEIKSIDMTDKGYHVLNLLKQYLEALDQVVILGRLELV